MTSVLEAMTAIRGADDRTATDAVPPPAASEAGIQLALQLRETPSSGDGRMVLFVPTARHADASPAAGDAVCGFLDLHDGPVLVMDLRAEPGALTTPAWFATLADDEQVGGLWGADAASNNARLWRPLTGRAEKLVYASSPQFAARLADARSRYPYILCIGDAVPGSVVTLMIAGLSDGVVLSVAPGGSTRSEMIEVTSQLRRARAALLGFVVDPRGARPGAGR